MKKNLSTVCEQPCFSISKKVVVWINAIIIIVLLNVKTSSAQRDVIIKKDSTEERCKILKETESEVVYAFIKSRNNVKQASINRLLVDTVIYNKYDSDLISHSLFKNGDPDEESNNEKPYQFSFSIGLNLGNILEFNAPSGNDKKSFSATSALDLGLNYLKDGRKFAMTNELHWIISLQKSGLTSTSHIQRATDDLSTLHDFSVGVNKSNKLNFNLIAKTSTSLFTIYDGDFFKDYNNNGKIQAFLNPYEVTLSPGIKYQPNNFFRLSISPYSVKLYGLTNQQIANTGFYTETFDANNNYDLFVFKQLGAEVNFWYDRKVKKWLDMQYRLGISSDYFTKLAKNGLMNGLFITKLKIIKNVSLSHRGILKGDMADTPFKPYYLQTILLSYSKSF